MTTRRRAMAPLLAAVAALATLTPVARADITAYDLQFLDAMAQGGYNSRYPEGVVRLARNECAILRTGHSTPRQEANSPNWSIANIQPGSTPAYFLIKQAV